MSTTTMHATRPTDRYSTEQIEEFRSRRYWEPGSLSDYIDRFAREDPDRVSVTDGYTELTRAELRARAYRFALRLKELGVVKGDRVQVQLPNWNEYVVIWVALARIGAVLVPTMPVYRDDEVQYVIDQSGAKISIVTPEFRNYDYRSMILGIKARTPALEQVIVVRRAGDDDVLSFEDLIAGDDVPSDDDLGPAPSPDDLHAIVYTSGTESRPKGCQHTFGTLSYTANALADLVFELTEDDVMFMPTPITHATGITAGLLTPFIRGAAVHVMDVWDPHDGLDRIERFRTTVSIAATPFLQMALAEVKAHPDHDVSSMRIWASAGAPIPEALLRDWRDLVPTCAALPVYGNSETMVVTAVRPGDPADKVVSSDGRSFDGLVLQVRDEQGAVLPVGAEGEITYTSPGLMLGYWQDPAKTDAAIGADGFFGTGDLGRLDEDGFLRVTGRIKDLIIRGGLNISAREVEENAAAHPAIAAIAAVSMPDEKLGEKVCAFVVPAGEHRITVEELDVFLRDERKIAPQKWPERIVFVDELPTTATGKVQKFELRRIAAQQPVDAVG